MSPAGWLPVHRDQLRAQRSVTSMGKLYLADCQEPDQLRNPRLGNRVWATFTFYVMHNKDRHHLQLQNNLLHAALITLDAYHKASLQVVNTRYVPENKGRLLSNCGKWLYCCHKLLSTLDMCVSSYLNIRCKTFVLQLVCLNNAYGNILWTLQ